MSGAVITFYMSAAYIIHNITIVNRLERRVTDDARVIIYERIMFIIQATACNDMTLTITAAMAFSIMTQSIMTFSIMTLSIMTLSIMTLRIMTLFIMTLSIMTLSIMILSIMTLSIMTLSIMTLTIMDLIVTLIINDTQYK